MYGEFLVSERVIRCCEFLVTESYSEFLVTEGVTMSFLLLKGLQCVMSFLLLKEVQCVVSFLSLKELQCVVCFK